MRDYDLSPNRAADPQGAEWAMKHKKNKRYTRLLTAGTALGLVITGLTLVPANALNAAPAPAPTADEQAGADTEQVNETGRIEGSALPAIAAKGDEPPWYLVPSELPEGVIDAPPAAEYQTANGVDAVVGSTLLELVLDHPEIGFSAAELGTKGQIIVYSTATEGAVTALLRERGISDRVTYAPAVLDLSAKNQVSDQITGIDGWLPSGQRVVSVEPAADGSSFRVVLDEAINARELDRQAIESAFSGLRVWEDRSIRSLDISIAVEYGPAMEAATRNHAPSSPGYQRFAGAYMASSGACTTGFRMTQSIGTIPAMGSAHHCGGTEGQAWQYSTDSTYMLGNWYSPYGPGLADGDVAVWKGTGVNLLVPGIFVGNHTVAGSLVYAIKGAIHSVIGADVCYSGSRSGTVCLNEITSTGNTICYIGHSPCYDNLVRTTQISGLPAAGNGDSGGPVYSTSSGSIYATGIISGISSGTTTCTGDPGTATRKCSASVIYAPIAELMSIGYGLNYIP